MELVECKELPKSSEMDSQTQTPPKLRVSFCWCIRLEPSAYVFYFFHLIGSMALLGACYLLAVEDGLITDMLQAAGGHCNLYKIAFCLTVVAVGQGLLSLALLYAVRKRYLRALHGYLLAIVALNAAALLYAVIATLLVKSGWFAISHAFLKRLPVFGLLVLSVHFIRMCYGMTKTAEKITALTEFLTDFETRKTPNN